MVIMNPTNLSNNCPACPDTGADPRWLSRRFLGIHNSNSKNRKESVMIYNQTHGSLIIMNRERKLEPAVLYKFKITAQTLGLELPLFLSFSV